MVYTVTFNPALDYVINVTNLKEGEVNRAEEEQILAGGKGINVSTVLTHLGIPNVMLGFVAGFTGKELVRILQKEGCNTDFIEVDGISRINVKLKSKKGTEINGIGPQITEEKLAMFFNKLGSLKNGDVLVLAGSIPKSLPDNIYMKIMESLADKNIKCIVDATKDLLINVLKYHPFLIKPNKFELEELFSIEIKDKETVIKYAKKLIDMGAENVLVSLAGDGAVLVTADGQIFENNAPKGQVINSVGAGDSMVAGFIAGYMEKKDFLYALKMGIAAGSASAFSKYLAGRQEVEAVFKCM